MTVQDYMRGIMDMPYTRKNLHFPVETWTDIVGGLPIMMFQIPDYKPPSTDKWFLGSLFGSFVFYNGTELVAWIECQYCRTTDAPKVSNGYLICTKCGAEA